MPTVSNQCQPQPTVKTLPTPRAPRTRIPSERTERVRPVTTYLVRRMAEQLARTRALVVCKAVEVKAKVEAADPTPPVGKTRVITSPTLSTTHTTHLIALEARDLQKTHSTTPT